MPEDLHIVAIAALLPLTACLLIVQVNPYQALVIRGILGAIAALVYVLFGAADVALTEALVGTMLSITLYAVAVRSSMSMRLGILGEESESAAPPVPLSEPPDSQKEILAHLRSLLSKNHVRLEPVPYADPQALNMALINKEIHTVLKISPESSSDYHLQTRVRRLYEILQTELPVSLIESGAASDASPPPKMPTEGQI
ncbi:hypothetical protein C1752_07515 [Acaryochloris thomasi RCC1774]|uniref:MrpA C-terminal/MbhD domain-containing protein n=1 Tax=Acaryochloris thomasi RCC1774 TaxID=1764569 RepID=A0A2W1JAT0_9CYAN|nr:DUF4040 domain-containing protein [Acaryochloris thomasi]PZD71239.1 hypothetical protein C1752_07515 [Acaryochloris thomasi RCC1774]